MKKMNTSIKNKKILLIFLFLFFGLTHTAQSSDVAYIYSIDSTNASAFKTFLNSIGSQTTLVEMGDIVNTDFSQFDVILIGSNSGYTITWGNPASVSAIVNSNKPILGLGEGGYAFYGKLSLNIGSPNGGHGSRDNIYVVQENHTIFNSPNPINVPQDSVIQLYNSTSSCVQIYFASPIPEVILLGRVELAPFHYLIVQEQTQYFIWGFDDSPSNMTQTGKDLFANIVDFMSLINTSIEDELNKVPNQFKVFQNYPNPFNPATTIIYQIPELNFVTLKIYDVLGSEVATLVNEEKLVGSYELEFNAIDLPSGVYLYKLQAGSFVETKKMILLK